MDIEHMLEDALARINAIHDAWGIAGRKTKEALEEVKRAKMLSAQHPTDERTTEEPRPDINNQELTRRLFLLSNKERELYLLIGKQLTLKQIVDKTGKSLKTIEAQLQKMKGKLGYKHVRELREEAINLVK